MGQPEMSSDRGLGGEVMADNFLQQFGFYLSYFLFHQTFS